MTKMFVKGNKRNVINKLIMCRINKMNDIGAPSHVNQQTGFNDGYNRDIL